MISGRGFYELCNWNICNRYKVNFEPKSIKEGDFLFLNLDNIWDFIRFLKQSEIPSKINLITHNSNVSFTDDMYHQLSNYCLNIYSINSISSYGIKIPLGFSDRLIPAIKSVDEQINEKTHLVYMNFKIYQSVALERKDCYTQFKSENWVFSEDNVPELQFYKNLKSSRYSFCPVGVGLDTHRFYESIYFNTIPIVKRNQISDLHSKFPCIIVNDWSEINKDYLETNYDRYQNLMLDWKKNNSDWLDAKKWL